jgi:Fe-Mn family superoxide dismutase
MTDVNRRAAIAVGAGLALAAGVTAPAIATTAASTPLFAPLPLAFDPATIAGLSERLILSHHQNNYGGAVRRLNQIAETFAAIDLAKAPGFQLNGLKREELLAWNSMLLHELYFAGFGQPNRPGRRLAEAIERDFGSAARWRAEFAAMGKALGGGSGWVLLAWSPRDRRLVNQWAADHTMVLAGSTLLVALDMYEHAYAIDYGAGAGTYVDAFMKAIDWGEADRRFGAIAV